MKSYFSRKALSAVPVALCTLLAVSSCKKVLEVEPLDSLGTEQTYRNVFDADAAVWGVYGKFMNLAKPYILFNELRGDLAQTTANADEYMKQLSTHSVTPENPYISPKPFYEVILNCNDVLQNFDRMLRENKMKQEEYNQRYSDILALRAWVYLQLGIHYGSVPYVTGALSQIDEVKDESKFPKVSFDQLLDSLITDMEAIPTKEEYPVSASLRTTIDNYPTLKFFINKYVMLGELYLWRGKVEKGDYTNAARNFKWMMEYGTNYRTNDAMYFDQYRVRYADVAGNNDIAVGYIRFRETDQSALVDNNTQGWRSIFARPFTDSWFNYEWIWALPLDKNFGPTNPFIELFSPVGGRYQVKPSQASIDNWNSQVQRNGFPFDARKNFSVRTIMGQPVIMKYLYNYIDANGTPLISSFERNSKWFLYRAATLHLNYAEAANRDGKHKIAYALVNSGINSTFDDPSVGDKTNLQRTFDPAPYDFMARSGGAPGPVFTDPWYRGAGIRGRAYVQNLPVVGDSTQAIENMIINEGALETAFEGRRWPDLLRVALRRNDPSFLATKIGDKLRKDGVGNAGAVEAALMDKKNWYLPFKW